MELNTMEIAHVCLDEIEGMDGMPEPERELVLDWLRKSASYLHRSPEIVDWIINLDLVPGVIPKVLSPVIEQAYAQKVGYILFYV